MINCKYEQGDPTWDALVKQVARMSGMERFPYETQAKRELVLALCNCFSLEEAVMVVSDFVHYGRFCPTAGEVRAKIYDLRPPDPPYSQQCLSCDGTGFVHITKGMYSAVKDCSCRRAKIEASQNQK